MVVLPHVYDPELYGEFDGRESKNFRLTYVGGFNQVRGIEPLAEIIQTLKAEGANLDLLKIELVGPNMQREEHILNDIHAGLAASTGKVGYIDSLHIMKRADCLLLLDADLEYSPFFPSKLVDYLGSGRPIVGISPTNSCSSKVLREQGFMAFDYRQLKEFAAYLKGILNGKMQLPESRHEKTCRYSAERVAPDFLSLVERARFNCFKK